MSRRVSKGRSCWCVTLKTAQVDALQRRERRRVDSCGCKLRGRACREERPPGEGIRELRRAPPGQEAGGLALICQCLRWGESGCQLMLVGSTLRKIRRWPFPSRPCISQSEPFLYSPNARTNAICFPSGENVGTKERSPTVNRRSCRGPLPGTVKLKISAWSPFELSQSCSYLWNTIRLPPGDQSGSPSRMLPVSRTGLRLRSIQIGPSRDKASRPAPLQVGAACPPRIVRSRGAPCPAQEASSQPRPRQRTQPLRARPRGGDR